MTGKDRKSTRLNSSHSAKSRMPSSASASAASPIQNNPIQFDGFQNALSTAVQVSNSTKVSHAEVSNLQGQKNLSDAKAADTLSNIDWYKLTPECLS